MKYALIADIHAHLAAIQAVLRDAEQRGRTHTACLGDIVGYYNKPKEYVDIIRERIVYPRLRPGLSNGGLSALQSQLPGGRDWAAVF
jgi:hypothetical protein